MLGVGCFAYIALHLALYIADQTFNMATVVSEIVLRYYLTIGFTAWTGMAVLAATSNDYMVRRALGGIRWRKLHRLVFSRRCARNRALFHAVEAGSLRAHGDGRYFHLADALPCAALVVPRNTEFPMWIIAGKLVRCRLAGFHW